MHARRLVKRSLIGSRVYAPGSGAAAGEAGERENRDAPVPSGHPEEEAVKGARKPSLKVCECVSARARVRCRSELVFVFVFVLKPIACYVGHHNHRFC